MELFKKIVDELAGWNVRCPKICICGMGEPLLHPEIVLLLRYLHEKRTKYLPHIELVTNGSRLTHEISEEICKYVDRIIISINGINEEDYKTFCNFKMDFTRFVDEIAYLYQHRKNCNIIGKIHQKALPSKEEEKKFFEIFSPITTSVTIENLVNQWSDFESICFSDDDGVGRYKEATGSDAVVKRKTCCPQPFKTLQIYANGDCIPCCADYQRQLCLGNVYDESIYDIWNGKRMFDLRIKHLKGERKEQYPCRVCVTPETTDVDNIDEYLGEIISRMEDGR